MDEHDVRNGGDPVDTERLVHGLESGPVRGVTRRRALQQAVTAAVAASIPFAAQAETAAADTTDDGEDVDPYLFTGTIVGTSSSAVAVDVAGETRKLPLTPSTSVWKGSNGDASLLAEGDVLMSRVDQYSQLVRGWDNLVPIRGTIADVSSGSLVLQGSKPESATNTAVQVPGDATMTDAFTGAPMSSRKPLRPDTGIVGIGVGVGDHVEATDIRVAVPSAAPTETTSSAAATYDDGDMAPDEMYYDAQLASCVYIYRGFATIFGCSGSGYCSSFSCGGNNKIAWPHLNTGCDCCNCCHCSSNCKGQIDLNCGKTITVIRLCNNEDHDLRIVDCGPCQHSTCCNPPVCNHVCNWCGLQSQHPIVDLTTETFTRYQDPDNATCFPCKAKVVTNLPTCS
jgi:hypothetical protein